MTESLFPHESPAPLHRPQQPIRGEGPMKWAPYSAVNVRKCDDCLQYTLEQLRDGHWAPLARQARFKLNQGGKTIAFLCAEHHQIRVEDAGQK
jgi:hypothetical protein